jgi:septum formation protein
MQIVLGSKSSRRKELLGLMGYAFIVDGVDADEIITKYRSSIDYAKQVALRKGNLVSKKYPLDLVICADTIVVVDDKILNKPVNKEEARQMINLISNRSHYVLTGVYIKYLDYEKTFVEKTKVEIDDINDDEIEKYINSPEPYDKAGGYAIQGIFAKHIKAINGDYYNVMGLPINKLYQEIKKIENKYKEKK